MIQASRRARLALLALCLFLGIVIGLTGVHFTGSSAWFLAVPALVLLGWLFVANPTECLPPNER